MNKTTSFSKIKSKKNDNLLLLNNNNNNNKTNIITTTPTNTSNTTSSTSSNNTNINNKDSFFIDSINETTLTTNKLVDRSSNLLFEPAPIELFADSIIESSNQTSNKISVVPTIELSHLQQQQLQSKLKNWNSESNLTNNKTRKKLVKLNKSLIHKNEHYDQQETSESYYDYDLENDPLQFSDHAGLFDTYEDEHEENDLECEQIEDEQATDDGLDNNDYDDSNLLINNYDVYKAAKHNYKLIYNDDNQSLFAIDKLLNNNNMNNNKKSQIDSLINSDLVMQHDNNNDDDDEYNQDSINQKESNYLYYLNKLTNEQSQISNSNLNDSIMNWSMKISNYNYTNHYQQQKQQIEYQLNSKKQRSQSRSPERNSHIIDYQIPRSTSSFSKLYFNNNNRHQNQYHQNQQQQKLSNKSTTSWGKLKHSKSSSSNIAPTSQQFQLNNESSQSTSNQIEDGYDDDYDNNNKQKNFLESVHVNDNLIKQPLSSPSLFRLFQNSKSNNQIRDLNSSSETNSFQQQQRTNRRNDHLNQQHQNDLNNKITKTTSFSQIRQRSLSSCAIGQNQSDFPLQPTSQQLPVKHQQQDLLVVVDTTGNNSKKSIGVQHPPSNQIDQSIQTSTIVCMLVDRNNSKTSKELIEVAARAARAAVAARRSYNLFNTKSSLPDLTFLKEYSDDFNKSQNNSSSNNTKNTSTNDDDDNQRLDESLLINEALNTNNMQLKNSLSSANLIKPISDLIKLDELAIKKSLVNQQQHQLQQQQSNISGSELLKRKTLKSIKRYRQTKQNTEPCNLITEQNTNYYQPNNHNETVKQQQQQQQKINSNNSSSSSTSSSSGATNTSGYVSNAVTNTNLIQQQSDKSKQPLKSCLKRKDSSSSSSNTQQQLSVPQTQSQTLINKPKVNSASSLIVTTKNKQQNQLNKKPIQKKTSTLMFLPYVGYLYTWDKDSSTRYVYYNNLERTRRIKSYKQMIRNSLDENDDDEDDEEEDDVTKETQTKQINEPQMVTSSRSYNDLRVKKSVTFLSHVIEHKNNNTPKKSKSISPSSTIETATTSTTPTTTGTLSTSSSTNSTKQTTNTTTNKSTAPLLQYDALIAMLKSNSIHNQSGLDAKTLNKQSPQLVSKTKQFKNNNSINKNKLKLDRQNSNEVNYFKKSQIIDADSISLASLSESPPSEFKFSDDEDCISSVKLNEHLQQAIVTNKSFNTNTNSSSATSSSSAGSTSSTNLINTKLNNHHNQQIKFNQMELIRNKKKNFHSILLKDTKLNNLKEILLEIKEQQQKLIHLANESKNQKEAALTDTNTPIKMSQDSSVSVTLNQTSILATTTTTTDNTVSIELRDTIERLAQYLFEFLKQGLKTATFDQLTPNNLSSSSIKTTTPTSITNTPAMSPSPVERSLPDSSSLTLTYSQYTQLWNLIEHTINVNLAATTQQSDLTFQCFKLPKEAYLSMYQEINSYSNNTNQTYLIDSGINTSQLRPNWFEYLNKDKTIIKKFYELKTPISNINGDSGVGDFICMSGSSSSTNSSISNLTSANNQANLTANLLASLSLTSLANVSIFENEEYFSYFHKLVQQFNFIEFNLKISKQIDKSIISRTSSPAATPKPTKYTNYQSPRKSSSSLSRHQYQQPQHHNTSIPISPSTPQNFTHHQQQHHQSSHNVFKNISKRLNIKSWFTSSSQSNNGTTSNSSTLPNHSNKTPPVSSQQSVYKKASQAPTTNKLVGTKSKASTPVISGPLNRLLNSTQLMKHSCSEPSLNEIIE